MNGTTVSVIWHKSKALANGEHPLMLRMTKARKRTMKSLVISVKAKHRDCKKKQPKPSCPNKGMIQQIVSRLPQP